MEAKPLENPKEAQLQSSPIIDGKHKLLQMFEISLWLDNYDDIFSDFDPRPYSQRALSDDFLVEAKKASKDKPSGKLELKFLIPTDKRNKSQEPVIKKRLRDHFTRHHNLLKDDKNKIIKKGALFVISGIILMFVATYILTSNSEAQKDLIIAFLIIFLEPAGWFFFWEGLAMIFFENKKLRPELEFYEKMSKCEIEFLSF